MVARKILEKKAFFMWGGELHVFWMHHEATAEQQTLDMLSLEFLCVLFYCFIRYILITIKSFFIDWGFPLTCVI